MNYRHIYHAGNFADAFKHVILMALLEKLQKKEKPLCYLDTHAGSGIYPLYTSHAKKTEEYKAGIERIIDQKIKDIPDIVKSYISIVKKFDYPLYYPGSSLIVRQLLRENDKMILTELHPEEAKILKSEFSRDKSVSVHQQDGYLALKAFLPPKEKRGLILIDPPYESKDEWNNLLRGLEEALKRFASGTYAIWYPLKDDRSVKQFLKKITTLSPSKTLVAELSVYSNDVSLGLRGCGMVIINAPWKFEEELNILVPWLWNVLSVNLGGQYSIF